jgi:hypothetical protein
MQIASGKNMVGHYQNRDAGLPILFDGEEPSTERIRTAEKFPSFRELISEAKSARIHFQRLRGAVSQQEEKEEIYNALDIFNAEQATLVVLLMSRLESPRRTLLSFDGKIFQSKGPFQDDFKVGKGLTAKREEQLVNLERYYGNRTQSERTDQTYASRTARRPTGRS